MKLIKTTAFVLLFMFLMISGGTAQKSSPPGTIKLLSGYQHRVLQGIDSQVGTISKQDGLQIKYDIGELAGDYSKCGDLRGCGEVWRKKQVINGQDVVCVFTDKKRLVVTFPQSHANFYATVHTEEELTDMLLMLFTYKPVSSKP
jgi:hypothetical protein